MKLVSLNVELDRHHDTVLPFLKSQKPDVVCLQELTEIDFEIYKRELGFEGIFKPITYIKHPFYNGPRNLREGVAIFAKNIVESEYTYYVGSEKTINLPFEEYFALGDDGYKNNAVIVSKIELNGKEYTIATTHFTLTKEGESTPLQLAHLDLLLSSIEKHDEIILVGDMNAPRKNETFSRIARKYKDNIPPEYEESLDLNIHRDGINCKGLGLMVDGLFTTPKYIASNVRLEPGVSDHMAILADIEKVD